jgi:hypothetical protein
MMWQHVIFSYEREPAHQLASHTQQANNKAENIGMSHSACFTKCKTATITTKVYKQYWAIFIL